MFDDLRHALRGLAGRPGFTVVAVLTLALAIGATTAIFSVVDGVLLRATPVAEIDRLVMVWETDRHTGTTREPASVPDFLDFKRDSRTLAAVEGVIGTEVNFAPPQGEPVRLAALIASRGLLPMLGIAPVAGRTFSVAEDQARGPKVALISESLWMRSFGRAPQTIGGTIRLDEEAYTVVGVMPDQADFGMLQILGAADYSRGYADRGDRATADVWLPLQADVEALPRSTHPILLVGRLASGASVSSAQTELTRLSAALERAYRENDGRGAFIEPLDAVVFGPARPALLMLWGAVGLVLLIGCVNVANLLLIRGRGRAREVAVRLALGASVWRLARQFLLENLALTLAGAALGVVLAVAALGALLALAPPSVPRLDAVGLNMRVLSLTLGLAMVTGLIFGLVPLLQAWQLDPQATLKSEGMHGASTGRSRRRTQRVLVMSELALAVMLVIGASLLVRSFSQVMRVDAGFHTTGVIKAEYQLPASRYPVDFCQVAEPGRDPRVHQPAAAAGVAIAWRRCCRRVRHASARSGLHQLVPGRGPRGRVGTLARAVDSQRDARLFPRHRPVAVAWASARRCRRHEDDARAGDQPGRRGAVLRGPRADRRAYPVLGRHVDDRRGGRQREVPRRHGGRPNRGLRAVGAGADARHRRAARARRVRPERTGGGHRLGRPRDRSRTGGLWRRAARRHAAAIGRAAGGSR